ncbi:AAEL009519-PA [Aedes aegypti]|uniref:AAEL009519-PA n=1 Tax=Aedes aegypti TaxID=7159 RepID=Q16VM0_AEDAE|nr:AAEL009519-PA [Aedes aegypti]
MNAFSRPCSDSGAQVKGCVRIHIEVLFYLSTSRSSMMQWRRKRWRLPVRCP